jgi:hypothetical protein
MPYVVTTKRPRPQEGGCGEILAVVSRRAGGTLEEAQAEAHRIVNAQPHRLSDPLWNNAIEAWPKSGGTVGPLPDGTVIAVKPTSKKALFDALLVDDQRQLPTWPLPTLVMVIHAYNSSQHGPH